MIPTLIINESRIVARLDAIGPSVRQKLVEVLTPLANEMAADARRIASAHIRFAGVNKDGSSTAGQYLNSIYGGVSTKSATRVTGYIRSDNNIAHLLEFGVKDTKDFYIQNKTNSGKFLLANELLGMVFGKTVNHHGFSIPAYPALGPAYEARKSEIKTALIEAGREGMRAEA